MLTRRELLGGAVLLLPLFRANARGDRCAAAAEPNELGPYYRASAPARASLCDAAEPGDPYALSGRIWGTDGCTPLADALVEVWHADASGEYDMLGPGKPRDEAVYHLRGLLRSARDGSYAFDTVVPGPYGHRARHIHFAVHAEGHEPFITQSYFAGDPRLASDRIARARNAVIARPADVRGRRGKRGRFDIALRPRRPNPPEAVATLDDYQGDFRFPDGGVLHHAREGDQLFVTVPGYGRIELLFDARDRFRVLEFDSTGHAERGPDGKLTALIVRNFGDPKPTRVVPVR
jgi:protocatechuate 3,4-dioxygenase beta subunit